MLRTFEQIPSRTAELRSRPSVSPALFDRHCQLASVILADNLATLNWWYEQCSSEALRSAQTLPKPSRNSPIW